MTRNANVMLVHGAWADGSCWSKVILLLQAKGINVTAAQIPLTSLSHDIAVTKRLLTAQSEATVMAAVQRPLSVASFAEKEGIPAWKRIPSWYLLCTNDQMIPPPAQEFFAQRMKATVRSGPSTHAPFMAHPQEVAKIIIEAVDAVSP